MKNGPGKRTKAGEERSLRRSPLRKNLTAPSSFSPSHVAASAGRWRSLVPFANPYLLGAIVVSSLLQISLLWFPLTRAIFFTAAPTFGFDWLLILALALAPVSLVELRKLWRHRAE